MASMGLVGIDVGSGSRKRYPRARMCLEVSGIYSPEPAMALHRCEGVELMVAKLKAVRDFAGALLRRSKTDALDADVLLEFARRVPFVVWQPPAGEVLELRARARRIDGLQRMPSQERNRLHACNRSVSCWLMVRPPASHAASVQ